MQEKAVQLKGVSHCKTRYLQGDILTPNSHDNPSDYADNKAGKDMRLSQISHDLRSALSDIVGGLQLIEKDRLDRETKIHFDRIRTSSETLVRLLDGTVVDDLPRTPTGRIRETNLADFLDDVQKRWGARALAHEIGFELISKANLPKDISVDRVPLDRILGNLFSNAIKFTDAGKVALTVECHSDKTLSFLVEDTGPGMSAEARSRLFEFASQPKAAAKPGTGLGLNIAKELSLQMGADLSVRNRPEGGTAAVLRIPYDVWVGSEQGHSSQRFSTNPMPVSLDGLHVMLAEDNETNQLVATKMLTSLGAEVVVASDGVEALEHLQTQRFDVAILDIEMPRMSGLELIKILRSSAPPLSELPLVALTAYVMQEHRDLIYSAGADGIIAKPVMSISEFGSAIKGHMERSNVRFGHADNSESQTDDSASLTSENAVVDRVVFDNLIKTIGPNSVAELLQKLRIDANAVAAGISRGHDNQDLSLIRSQTHILISVAGAIGAKPLEVIAHRLNATANQRDTKEVAQLCVRCLSGLDQLQAFILSEQARIPNG